MLWRKTLFKKTPYQSLVRESIQNSLDAVADTAQPVKVRIVFKSIKKLDFPSFFELKEHIDGCVKYYSGNQNARDIYGSMLNFFSSSSTNTEIGYIKISDSNTKGMEYVKGDTNSPFYAFMHSVGVSAKQDSTAGGSFGFGKSAYFNMSPISTVMVSTKTIDGKTFFQGAASLCTHTIKINDIEQKKVAYGFYDDNGGSPIEVEENIPAPFKRANAGTDVCIMGFDVEKLRGEAKKEIIEAVMRHFWMAIYSERLTVVVADGDGENDLQIRIDKSSLKRKMKDAFPEMTDRAHFKNHNPRPYYDAVLNATGIDDKKYFKFTQPIDLLGEVSLYLKKDKDGNDKTIYMRRPLMTVKSSGSHSNYGYYGVFVCENNEGNELLRAMENPTHDEWDAGNCKKGSLQYLKAKDVNDKITDFIKKCVETVFLSNANESLSITGLENYLYTPESLMDSEDDVPESSNPQIIGSPKRGIYVPESPVRDTDIKPIETPVESKEDNIGQVRVHTPGEVHSTKDGSGEYGTGHHQQHSKTKAGRGTMGPNRGPGVISDPSAGSHVEFIPVRFRVVAQTEEGKMCHYIIIHSEYDVPYGEIDVVGAGEEKDEKLKIVSTDQGTISDSTIMGVKLVMGTNRFKLRFGDDLKHSIKLKTYGKLR